MEKPREGEDLYDYLLRIEANPRRTTKGWSIRCLRPDHSDRNNSAVMFDDGWVHCFGGCKRFSVYGPDYRGAPPKEAYEPKTIQGTVDYFDYWLSLEPLDDGIKGLPARHFNSLGWRKLEDNNLLGAKGGIFIPYFTMGRDKIMFYQVRHLEGSRRFTFTPGVTPIANGYESIPRMGKYCAFTEGASDRAVLEFIGIPTIALPSASSGTLLKKMAAYVRSRGAIPVACSDNDVAGDKLLSSLEGVSPYIDLRPPAPFKDYGDMFEQKGIESVKQHLHMLLPKDDGMMTPQQLKEKSEKAWQIFFS